MGRRFTESEVLAMTRNRREDKVLREKLFKISEERGIYHDNLKKERKKISQLCIESRRTSGNSPCPDCQFLCEKSDHVTIRQMQRHNKPWSVTPSESTFNVLFQKNNFASSESQKLRKRVNSVGKSRDTRNQNTPSNGALSDVTLLNNHAGNPANLTQIQELPVSSNNEKDPHIIQIQEQLPVSSNNGNDPHITQIQELPVSSNNVYQCVKTKGSQSLDYDQYANTLKQDANRQRSPNLMAKKSETLERRASISSSSKAENQQKLTTKVSGNSSKRSKIVSAKSEKELKIVTTNSENKPEKCQGGEGADTNLGIQRCVLNENVCANEKSDKRLAGMQENIADEAYNHFPEQETTVNKHLAGNDERNARENEEHVRLPVVEESPHENSEETREQEYVMVYTIQAENKRLDSEENGEQEGTGKRSSYVRSQTSVDDRQIQIVDVALENDGTAAITLSHVEKQRPHTVAGGELISYSEDLDLKSLTDVDHRDYLWFRGKKLHNYVKPQDRYKHDPFKMKKREKLMKKLATETPVFAEDQREQILNVDLTFSKATRARLLKQLVEENSSKRQGSSTNGYEQTLNSKIEHFMKSIEDFCDKK